MSAVATQRRTREREARYRAAERTFWDEIGLTPAEEVVELVEPRLRLRLTEVGSGPPVLFVPGTGGTGPYWGPLVKRLPGYRCLLLDRPGWGLSEPVEYGAGGLADLAVAVTRGVLDALGIGRAPLVGASIGGLWAMRAAAALPERVERVALLGAAPLVDEVVPPVFIRLLRTPLGALVVRLRATPGMLDKQLRGLGHGPSLDAGRMPPGFAPWRVSFDNDTDSMRHERDLVKAVLGGSGWKPGSVLGDDDLRRVSAPVLMVLGDGDSIGSPEVFRAMLGRLGGRDGRLEVLDGAGHLPWLDHPDRVAALVAHFLGATEPLEA